MIDHWVNCILITRNQNLSIELTKKRRRQALIALVIQGILNFVVEKIDKSTPIDLRRSCTSLLRFGTPLSIQFNNHLVKRLSKLHYGSALWDPAPLVRSGTSFVRSGTSLVKSGTSFVRFVTSLVRSGTSFVRSGTSFVRSSTSFVRSGTPYVWCNVM